MQEISKEELLRSVKYNQNGLVAVIAQQFDTKEVLMMAYANATALKETLTTGRMCYFSRSRQELWRKGDTSGHTQALKEIRIDCDGDAILALIDQTGAACHTNNLSCFYRAVGVTGLVFEAP